MRLFTSILLFFIVFSTLQSQDRTFDAGLVLGFNMSQIDGDDMGGAWVGYRQLGLSAGGRVQFNIAEKWVTGFEILFSQLGSDRGKFDIGLYDNIRLNCVEVPVTITFLDWADEFDGQDFYHIGFNAGLTYARTINYKVIRVDGADITEETDFQPNMVMYHLGFTYYINPKFGVTALWTKGINDFDRSNEFFISRQITLKGMYYF